MNETIEKTEYGEVFIRKDKSGDQTVGLCVHTNIGDFVAYPNTDPNYPGISLMFIPKNNRGKKTEIDITSVEVNQDQESDGKERGIVVYEYDNPYSEEWTNRTTIMLNSIKEALSE